MIYAPVIIPTLCRSEHFIRCIESLQKNTYAARTEIYVAVDYPRERDHEDGYRKICEYLSSYQGTDFASFNVIYRQENYGSDLNERCLLDEVILQKYDCWIRTDDDVEFSSNFIEYIDKCLTYYANDENIVAVAGYAYPCVFPTSKATVIRENCFLPMWGTGFWKEKYVSIRKKLEEDLYLHNMFEKNLHSGSWKRLIDARYLDFVDGGLSWQAEKLVFRSTDVAWSTYIGLEDKSVIMPVISKARNYGFDGSGVTCPKADGRFEKQHIDVAKDFHIIEDHSVRLEEIRRVINAYDNRKKSRVFRAKVKLAIYKCIGKKRYRKLWMKRNQKKYKSFIE